MRLFLALRAIGRCPQFVLAQLAADAVVGDLRGGGICAVMGLLDSELLVALAAEPELDSM